MSAMKIPDDEEQRNIIDKLANFVARNGPKFEELTKSKQKDNPKFAFLFGGDYHSYYCWKVGLETTQCEAQKRLNQQQEQPPPPPSFQQQQLPQIPSQFTIQPPEVIAPSHRNEFDLEEFRVLLQKLILACTKDNIQNGKTWIVENCKSYEQFTAIGRFLFQRMLEESLPFQQKLHIVYLTNDLLHHSRKKDVPLLQEGLQNYILPIVAIVHNGEAADNQQKLAKVVKIWETQKFFSPDILEKLCLSDKLYDTQLDIIEKEREYMRIEKDKKQREEQEQRQQEEEKNASEELSNRGYNMYDHPQHPQAQDYPPPPMPGHFQQFQQFNQWHQPPPPPVAPQDPYHFYGSNYTPSVRPPAPFPPPRFPLSDQGNFDQQPPGYPPYDMPPQFQNSEIQTFDYSHQRVPPGPTPMTFDYEHGRAHHPPEQEVMHDPTIPMAPYYDLPAGLMVPLIKIWDCEYNPIDPKDLRLPIPQPPSERLLAAIEAFYSPPSHERPRDSQGWEKNGLFEFYKAKLKYIKDKERNLSTIDRSLSPPSSRSPSPESAGSPLVKERKKSRSPSPARSRSRSRDRQRSTSPKEKSQSNRRSASKSRSRSPARRSRSRSYSRSHSRSRSRSRSKSRSPPRRSPLKRSPTPPESFVGFTPRPMESRIDDSNVGHQMLMKMGWGGQGLGKKETGIVNPIKGGEIRDRQDKFKGIGSDMNDPFENFRKNKSYSYSRPRSSSKK
ncbi:calcium homeostasis endoplasmic reticulum protein isoform X1 [Hydra vulgaris]|uniref:calcium homeostasis endoplasmic reticulum protein isoform X1 n=1 Tax=Hydra vulgaris TaxID=6087 RepID=UPI001F5F34D5|nr:calcium homeostasis endoplasmic reticulum protein [Hydra vulgaris]